MSVLVTGATGMIGASLVQQLLERGESVRALVRSPDRARALLPADCKLFVGDVTNPASLDAAMKDCRSVYHAAGLPEQWFANPEIFQTVNVGGTRNVLEAARRAGVSRVVYTSTIDVFKAAPGESYDESTLDDAPKGTYYERSKQDADRIAVQYLERGLDIVFLHPAGLYGPGPDSSPGTNHFIRDLILGKIPMLLPGGFPLVYSADCARGHILAADQARAGDRFILSESYQSLVELAQRIAAIAPVKKIPPVMPLWFARLFSAGGELTAQLTKKPPLLPRGQLTFLLWQARPDSARAQRTLGWKPLAIDEGLRQTIDFLRSSGAL